MTRPEKPEHQGHYREELEVWLRLRFRYLCMSYLVLGVLDQLLSLMTDRSIPPMGMFFEMTGKSVALAVIAWFLLGRNWVDATRTEVLGAANRMILIVGIVSLVAMFGAQLVQGQGSTRLILPLFFWHLSACLFLPWTWRESLRPFVPLYVAWAFLLLVFPADAGLFVKIMRVIFGCCVFVPGISIAIWRLRRHSKSFRVRMVGPALENP